MAPNDPQAGHELYPESGIRTIYVSDAVYEHIQKSAQEQNPKKDRNLFFTLNARNEVQARRNAEQRQRVAASGYLRSSRNIPVAHRQAISF